MKRTTRILAALGCAALLLASWAAALLAKTDAQRQAELLEQAGVYLADKVYIRAIPLLEEAAGYQDDYTLQAEEELKQAYLQMLSKSGYERKYTDLLDRQMARPGAGPEVFQEAAEYYLDRGRVSAALGVLRDGIRRTDSEQLRALYEANRYRYRMGRNTYQDVTAPCNGAIQVFQDGFWGLAKTSGSLVLPCMYDWVSTYSGDRAVVEKDGEVYAVNSSNDRLALLHSQAEQVGNYGDFRLTLRTDKGWQRADGELNLGSMVFEGLGTYSGGCIPAMAEGRWGVLDTGSEWLIPPQYDGIVQDGLGRCGTAGAVFVRQGEQVLLLVDGQAAGDVYEDARPFDGGWAAVKKDGRWGYIDAQGQVQLDFQFDDALSFGQHLAAVKQGDYWGYISLSGELVIQPEFFDARSFSGGSAAVQTADGWKFITLLETEEGNGL